MQRLRPIPSRRLPGVTLIDFESRSRCALKKRGGRNYWADPSTEAICAVLYNVEVERWYVWYPGDDYYPHLEVAVAHNADNFDRFGGERCGWDVGAWADSSSAARRAGLPGKLDELGKRWLDTEKDAAGSRFTLALSRPSRARAKRGQLPEITDEARERVTRYCYRDVRIMRLAWARLAPWLEVDVATAQVDRIVNDRGICLDKDMVHALQRQLRKQQDEAVAAAAKATGMPYMMARATAMSPAKLTAYTGLENAQADTVKDAVKRREVGDRRGALELCAARLALASVVPGKLEAALNGVSPDGRLRDMLLYYGAHTGRWSGKGYQPHNQPRVGFEDDAKKIGVDCNDYVDALCDGALHDEALTKKEVSGLLRTVLRAGPGKVLTVLDYSGIEARANAWAAGDEKAIDVFKALDAGTGPDPYKVMAGRYLFGVDTDKVTKDQRGLGKIAELMLGYGAGAEKFRDSCEDGGADLDALGIDAEEVVRAYREDAHPEIVRLWKACEKAFRAAVEDEGGGHRFRAGKWHYESRPALDGRGGIDVWCVLPSGRPVIYANARAKRVRRKSKNGTPFVAWDLSYQGRKAWRERVYGGLLTENAVQALCSDLLRDALIRCERAGLDPVLHVHDELVNECDRQAGREALGEQRHIMSTPPRWARGLPIRLDGFIYERYRK